MPYIDKHQRMPHRDPTSSLHGKPKDNNSRPTKTHNHRGKDLGRPHLIPQLPQNHGTINQFLWTSTGQEHQEAIGGDEGEDHLEGTSYEPKIPEPREGCKVCVSTVGNKDISLAIAPQSRSAPILTQPSSSTGAQKTMKVTLGQLPISAAKCAPKRQSGGADYKDGSPRRKFFGGLIHAAWIRRMGSDRMYLLI